MKNIISISFRFSLGVFCVCFYLYKVGQFLCYVVYFWFWRTFYLYFPVYSEFSCQHQCNLLIAYSSPKCPIMCWEQRKSLPSQFVQGRFLFAKLIAFIHNFSVFRTDEHNNQKTDANTIITSSVNKNNTNKLILEIIRATVSNLT